jgi:hypothetical protein
MENRIKIHRITDSKNAVPTQKRTDITRRDAIFRVRDELGWFSLLHKMRIAPLRVCFCVFLVGLLLPSLTAAQSLSPDQEVLLAEVQATFAVRQGWAGVTQQRQLTSQWAITRQQNEQLNWNATTLALDVAFQQTAEALAGDLRFSETLSDSQPSSSTRQSEVAFTLGEAGLELAGEDQAPQAALLSQQGLFNLERFLIQDFSAELLACTESIYDLGVTRQRDYGQVQAYDLTLRWADCPTVVNFQLESLLERLEGIEQPLALRQALLDGSSLVFHLEFQRSSLLWIHASLSLNLSAEGVNPDGSRYAIAYGQVESAFYSAIQAGE